MSSNCLVLIDIQNGFITDETKHIPIDVKNFIEKNKMRFSDIVATAYINHENSGCYKLGNWKDCMAGTEESEVVDILKPYITRTFMKDTYTCFTPEFTDYIKTHKYDKVYFCGIDTGCCVLASVFSCYDMVQDCAVISDLCGSVNGQTSWNSAIQLLKENITEERLISSLAFL